MTQQSEVTSTGLPAWQAESLRLTAFTSPAAEMAQDWWGQLLKEPPDTKIARPKGGVQQEEGAFEKGKLIMQSQPTRVDWYYTLTPAPEGEDEGLPTLGSFPAVAQPFIELMLRWLEIAPRLVRLAFGTVLLLPAKDRDASYRQLAGFLPFSLDPEGSSDFNYQINRPRISGSGVQSPAPAQPTPHQINRPKVSASGVPALRVNRLSRWSSMAVQRSVMTVQAQTPPAFQPVAEYHACRLELDINTDAYFEGELPKDKLVAVFKELVDFAIEIATKGEKP